MLGNRIRELRERKGISLEELARKSSISVELMVSIEDGDVDRLDDRTLIRIADCLSLQSIYDYIYLIRLNAVPLKFKAYCVGLPKTGTTSIAGMLGNYRSAHEYYFEKTASMVIRHKNNEVTDQEYRKFVKRRDSEAHLEMDSASFNHVYLDILKGEYRDAKFVFTIRDCYSWLDSVINMYLRGDPVRGYSSNAGIWMEEYTDYLFGVKKSVLENEEELCHYFQYYVDRLLLCWASKNKALLENLPIERSLIIKTHEISHRSQDLANFLAIPIDTLIKKNSHLYKARKKFEVLRRIDPVFLQKKCKEYCSSIMDDFFPNYSLNDFFKGISPE